MAKCNSTGDFNMERIKRISSTVSALQMVVSTCKVYKRSQTVSTLHYLLHKNDVARSFSLNLIPIFHHHFNIDGQFKKRKVTINAVEPEISSLFLFKVSVLTHKPTVCLINSLTMRSLFCNGAHAILLYQGLCNILSTSG